MTPASRRPSSRSKKSAAGKGELPTGLERLRRRLQARKLADADALFAQIAEQVSERRQAWDLSQAELAELVGTTQSAIARIERGRRPPRIDTLQRIANALDCELDVELRPRTSTGKGKGKP